MSSHVQSGKPGFRTHYGQVVIEWSSPSWAQDSTFFAFVFGPGDAYHATVSHSDGSVWEFEISQDTGGGKFHRRHRKSITVYGDGGYVSALNEASTELVRVLLEGRLFKGQG